MTEETPLEENGNSTQEEQEALRDVEEMLREVEEMDAAFNSLPEDHPLKRNIAKLDEAITKAKEAEDASLVARLELKKAFLADKIGSFLQKK